MNHERYEDGVLRERWDDLARLYTSWDEEGTQTEQRPYTAQENADADARLAQREQESAEASERAQQDAIFAAIAATADPPPDGQEWVQPTGTHDAYPIDATVLHVGKTWTSLVAFNVWEPGVSSWREQAGTGYPVWVQPTGSSDAYAIGDRVQHNGADWESQYDANVWEPGVFGWIDITGSAER